MAILSSMSYRVFDGLAKEDWLDFVFAHVNPMVTFRKVMARIVAIHQETPDIKRFVLSPNRHWQSFEPGQYVAVRPMIDGIYHERCYSLSNSPQDSMLEIGVKRQPMGKVSNWLHDVAQVGDVIELGDVGGSFVLPEQMPNKLLLIAGGSGVTPIISLLQEALRRTAQLDVNIIYYVNTEQDVAYGATLAALAKKHASLVVNIAFATQGDAGRFSDTQLSVVCPDFAERTTYLCGPSGLMDAVNAVWQARSISAPLILERFGPAAVSSDVIGNAMPITLRRSQQVVLNTRPSILESAEAEGARPAYGCRIGICKTCSCMKVSGVVRDKITGAIDEGPNSMIRICVSEPLSPVVLDI